MSFGAETETNMESKADMISMGGFNGGKMAHVFEFDSETRLYKNHFASLEAEEALAKGQLFYKIDGSNGMLMTKDSGDFLACQRLDTRGRDAPEGCVALPDGGNTNVYEGHSYYYEPINPDVQGKKAKKRNQAMLDVVERHKDHLKSLGPTVSIEWVGTKFNSTPGVPHDVAIAIHSEQICTDIAERTYSGMKDYLLSADPPIEGLIIEHEGVFWKIRADCFDKKCLFKTKPSSARPPVFLF